MKKKRVPHGAVLLVILTALALWGCGSDKNLNPEADLIYRGADPSTANVGVNPPLNHLAYFLFDVKLNDPNLSMVGSDAWTVDRVEKHYLLVSDPGGHLSALPEDDTQKLKIKVSPGNTARVPVNIVSDTYLLEKAQDFVGTSDTARLKLRLTFHAHRNKDGAPKVVQASYFFNIGNY